MSLPIIGLNASSNTQDVGKQLSGIRTQMASLRDAMDEELNNISYNQLDSQLRAKIDKITDDLELQRQTNNEVAELLNIKSGDAYARIIANADAIVSEVARASESEGQLSTRITQTADAITSEATRAQGAEGTLSSRITQTATDITSEVTRAKGAEGDLSSRITQTADAITSEVTRAQTSEGNLSSRITQTATDITSEVTRAQGAEGTLSSAISQNAGQIALKVNNSDYTASVIVDKINNGSVTIAANKVNLQGYVTATSLSSEGETTINGANITTGTITGRTLSGCNGSFTTLSMFNPAEENNAGHIIGRNVNGEDFEYIRFYNSVIPQLYFYSNIYFNNCPGVYLSKSNGIQFGHPVNDRTSNNIYYSINTATSGNTTYGRHRFNNVSGTEVKSVLEPWYNSSTGASGINENVSSSRRYKENIRPLDDRYATNLLNMEVVSYDYIDGEKGYHGMIAEDVSDIDSYGVAYDSWGRPDAIDYKKYIPDLIRLCQIQQEKINELESRIREMEVRNGTN